MSDNCQQCGKEFEGIGVHWETNSKCEHKSLTEHQREIVVGLLMGDGSLNTQNKNPRLQVQMTSPNYLEYVANKFGVLGGDILICRTAEENARHKRESGFRPNADPKDYSDVYQWSSMCHPELKEFENWYSSGKKVWPPDIELTPTVLKHWYIGDGSWNNTKRNNNIRIGMSNEVENTDKVDRMFENSGLPSPSSYRIWEEDKGNGPSCEALFTIEQSIELWNYMGKPLPDFHYKWPEKYR